MRSVERKALKDYESFAQIIRKRKKNKEIESRLEEAKRTADRGSQQTQGEVVGKSSNAS